MCCDLAIRDPENLAPTDQKILICEGVNSEHGSTNADPVLYQLP